MSIPMGGDHEISLGGGGGGGRGPDVLPGPIPNNEASGFSASAVSEHSSRTEDSDSMGPALAAADDVAEQNGPLHHSDHGGTPTGTCYHERLDRSYHSGDGDKKTSAETETGKKIYGGGGDNGRIWQDARKIPPHSGVRLKFIVESLRMEMIHLQQQNAKLRRIVAMRLPDRSDDIFDACCSVSASRAVAARKSFVKMMAEELAKLGFGDIDDDDDDEEEGIT
eukprot:CAMPEP_0185817880 /NCGR_PEP_ID=MMETSP1322-20130828/19795_1 /TAXON_ID=265543 /ORGANISM="Minutocellus polymorphus, Strain RCC2270" /LENGTH=222 /DNA_ID=CAMNT_0028514953 /DNA_START=225 /DNA_END=893 /DNA_ORIENTATION=+